MKEGAEMKGNRLYERGIGWVQYNEQQFIKLRRMRFNVREHMLRQKRCFCPKPERWRCNAICEGCPYSIERDLSLDKGISGSEDLTLADVLTDGTNQENASIDKIYYEDVLRRLDDILPIARKIGQLRLEGKTDREIAKILGVSRTSMYRMLDKAKSILSAEFEEI